MKNTFAIYYFQFDQDNGNEKAFDTTMVGEVNLSSTNYIGLTPEEACMKRINTELEYKKNCAAEQRIDHVVNFGYQLIKNVDKEAGVDKVLHKYFKNTFCIDALKSSKNNETEEFNMGNHYLTYITEAISYCFGTGKIEPIKFVPRVNQLRCIEKMKNSFAINCSKKFLVGAICRFGKTATMLHFFTNVMKKKHILILTAKCDAIQSWQADYIKFIGNTEYEFLLKEDLKDVSKLTEEKSLIAMVSFQSAAKNYTDDYEIASNSKNIKWQKEVAKFKWDVVLIDECHFGVDTNRSQSFLNEVIGTDTLKVEISATPYKKELRREYDSTNSFIYELPDEYHDYENGLFD